MARPLRLLMIEDSEDDAALLELELQRAGYDPITRRVETAADLERALDSPWDIILCDYRLPALDAMIALSVIRGRQIDTPCVIVSGTIGEEHAVAALRCGAQDFILKDKLARLAPAIERELRDSETRLKGAHAESTLRAAEASLRAAFELIPDGVLVCLDGVVVHANGAAVAMLAARDPDALVGRPLVELFLPSEEAAVHDRMKSGVAAPASLGDLTMVRVDGAPVHVEVTFVSMLFDGEPATLGVFRDVSAQREIVARTMQVDRMLAVGILAAGVGHEINDPLASVMVNLTQATDHVERARAQLEKLGDSVPAIRRVAASLAEVVTILADVDEGAHRIRDIAGDLDAFSRTDGELVPIDLRAVADSALRMATPEVRHKARVTKDYGDVPRVLGSTSRLSQVILNLVVNASHAIARNAYASNEIVVRIRSEGTNVVVEVQDTGSGIAPEHLGRLFTPFFTTKPVGQGTGLGLSISREIVRALGGDIEVESAPGAGTTMRVVLPAAPAAALGREPPVARAFELHEVGEILGASGGALVGDEVR